MNNETANAWQLLAEELAPMALQELTGGTGGISTNPHDLVTPANRVSTYDDDPPEVEETV